MRWQPETAHVIVSSTYGDGELPTGSRAFYDDLIKSERDLSELKYAIFGMGDRSYVRTYSRGSELIHEALAAHSAQCIGEYGRHDAGSGADSTETALDWVDGVLTTLHSERFAVTNT